VERRGLLLRIFPADTEDGTGALPALYEEEGFTRNLKRSPSRTAIIDLSYPLQELRRSLRPTWRRNLVLAERNDLRIVRGTASKLFDVFAGLYREMLHRKRRVSSVSIDRFIEIQKDLPEALKLQVMLCEYRGEAVAGLAAACFGNTALNVLSATGEKGLRLRASYFLQWGLLQWLKEQSCRWYDLDLIDQQAYPGMTQFKLGFAGRLGSTPEYLGPFESCARAVSQVSVQLGFRLQSAYKRVKRNF
jgi:lipid II:glycine glycyltransferase (peptidoglycan interpeptide bridge formation enzyme)